MVQSTHVTVRDQVGPLAVSGEDPARATVDSSRARPMKTSCRLRWPSQEWNANPVSYIVSSKITVRIANDQQAVALSREAGGRRRRNALVGPPGSDSRVM